MTHTHSGTHILGHAPLGAVAFYSTLKFYRLPNGQHLATCPLIQSSSLSLRLSTLLASGLTRTHTHTHALTLTHTSRRGHKPEAAFFARSGAPKSVNRQFQLFYRLRSACQMAGAKCQYHQPVLAVPGFFPLLPLSLPAHEITKNSAVGGQGCRDMSHEWTEGNGADHCDW